MAEQKWGGAVPPIEQKLPAVQATPEPVTLLQCRCLLDVGSFTGARTARSGRTKFEVDSLLEENRIRTDGPYDDIGQRNTTDWPEPSHRVADRQQGIGVHAAAPPSIALAYSNLRYPPKQNLVVIDATRKENRIKRWRS